MRKLSLCDLPCMVHWNGSHCRASRNRRGRPGRREAVVSYFLLLSGVTGQGS